MTDERGNTGVSRRSVLGGVGATAASALAGCGSNSVDSEDAYFSHEILSGEGFTSFELRDFNKECRGYSCTETATIVVGVSEKVDSVRLLNGSEPGRVKKVPSAATKISYQTNGNTTTLVAMSGTEMLGRAFVREQEFEPPYRRHHKLVEDGWSVSIEKTSPYLSGISWYVNKAVFNGMMFYRETPPDHFKMIGGGVQLDSYPVTDGAYRLLFGADMNAPVNATYRLIERHGGENYETVLKVTNDA